MKWTNCVSVFSFDLLMKYIRYWPQDARLDQMFISAMAALSITNPYYNMLFNRPHFRFTLGMQYDLLISSIHTISFAANKQQRYLVITKKQNGRWPFHHDHVKQNQFASRLDEAANLIKLEISAKSRRGLLTNLRKLMLGPNLECFLQQVRCLHHTGILHECASQEACRSQETTVKRLQKSHEISKSILKHLGVKGVMYHQRTDSTTPKQPSDAFSRALCGACEHAPNKCERKFIQSFKSPPVCNPQQMQQYKKKVVFFYIARSAPPNIDLEEYWRKHPLKDVLLTLWLLTEASVKYDDSRLPNTDLPEVICHYEEAYRCTYPLCDTPDCVGPEYALLVHSEKYGPIFYLQLPPYRWIVPVYRHHIANIQSRKKIIIRQITEKLHTRKRKAEQLPQRIVHVGADDGIIEIA